MKILLVCSILTLYILQEIPFPLKKIMSKENVDIAYIYYKEGDGVKNNGLNLYIHNRNKFEIKISFILIFNTDSLSKEVFVKDTLNAGEISTGSTNNLYWLPFKKQIQIRELGIKKLKIEK